MTTGSDGSLWGRFEHDPRDPAYAGMRASDLDRAVVHDALASAYAEGRIDRDELDERTTQVDAAKTYGELVPPLHDLAADAVASSVSLALRPELQRQARGYYREKLGEAFMGFLVPNLIAWVIWFFFAGQGLPWPLFVTIPTLANLVRVASRRQSIVDERVRKLEKKQAKALEPPKAAKPPSAKAQKRPEEA